MTKLRSLALLLLLSAGCAAEEAPSADDARAACARMRDHLIDLDVEHVAVDREAHRVALERALGDGFLDECVAHRSSAAVTCAAHAGSLEVAARCEGSRATEEVAP